MSTNSQEQEIDLGQLFKKIGDFFSGFVDTIFDFIFFIQKKIIIIVVLLILGIASAYILDGKKRYEHELSVIPNFGSNEYLYKSIEELNTKLKEKDPGFFKKVGIHDFKDIMSIDIEAYPAVYSFVNNKEQENNFELIKLMAEDGDLEKILENEITSKNYYHHKISIVTKGMWKKEDLIDPILNFLNKSDYFLKQQKVVQQNLEDKLVANDSLVKQIDNIILLLSSNKNGGGNISISENSSIPDLVDKKDFLITESQQLKTSKIIYDKIIKEESSILNIRNYVPFMLNSKVLLPLIFVFIYLFGFAFMKIYNKQKLKKI